MRNEIFKELLSALTPSVRGLAEELQCSDDLLHSIARGDRAGITKSKELALLAKKKASLIKEWAERLEAAVAA